MAVFRQLLNRIVYKLSGLVSIGKVKRNPLEQASVDRETAHLTLYSYKNSLPCAKVNREIKRLNLDIEIRDVNRAYCYRTDLIKGGGKLEVPCLHIRESKGERWLYDSNEIASYLNTRFSDERNITAKAS